MKCSCGKNEEVKDLGVCEECYRHLAWLKTHSPYHLADNERYKELLNHLNK
ncbi:hypothetical protein M0R04_13185 [Candidatus Dojkabacteria bacterium]|jgi:hypothetical protein|nr:hypothetical protein [Candidatus Dojkabacteria bacterium]